MSYKHKTRVLIAAGGSGGHIFPAIALARTLKEKNRGIGIKFVGSNKDLDRRIFEREGFEYAVLSVNHLPHGSFLRMPLFLIKLFLDIFRSFSIISAYKPDVVAGFGGYTSFPVLIAANFLNIPRLIHEQNVVPGRANRFLFKTAQKIAISFARTEKFLGPDANKAVLTGNPIRLETFNKDRESGINRFGFNSSKFTILIIGGSQGAHFLNETFIRAMSGMNENMRPLLQVIHITGIKDYEWAMKEYEEMGFECRVYSFIDRIEEAYSAADLIVSRSGASAIFEIAFFAKPMILIPYPFAMVHQAENARVFSEKGAAIVLKEDELSSELFKNKILDLINDKNRLKEMAEAAKGLSMPEASDKLADAVISMIKKPAARFLKP